MSFDAETGFSPLTVDISSCLGKKRGLQENRLNVDEF
jgi:hypothetical protein